MKWLHRKWCALFHRALMQPVSGQSICRRCHEVWDASVMGMN
jgi:hypothetical protein